MTKLFSEFDRLSFSSPVHFHVGRLIFHISFVRNLFCGTYILVEPVEMADRLAKLRWYRPNTRKQWTYALNIHQEINYLWIIYLSANRSLLVCQRAMLIDVEHISEESNTIKRHYTINVFVFFVLFCISLLCTSTIKHGHGGHGATPIYSFSSKCNRNAMVDLEN